MEGGGSYVSFSHRNLYKVSKFVDEFPEAMIASFGFFNWKHLWLESVDNFSDIFIDK